MHYVCNAFRCRACHRSQVEDKVRTMFTFNASVIAKYCSDNSCEFLVAIVTNANNDNDDKDEASDDDDDDESSWQSTVVSNKTQQRLTLVIIEQEVA